jgi:hypothetical protein
MFHGAADTLIQGQLIHMSMSSRYMFTGATDTRVQRQLIHDILLRKVNDKPEPELTIISAVGSVAPTRRETGEGCTPLPHPA